MSAKIEKAVASGCLAITTDTLLVAAAVAATIALAMIWPGSCMGAPP